METGVPVNYPPPPRAYDDLTPQEIADAKRLSPRQKQVAEQLSAASQLSSAAHDELNRLHRLHADAAHDHEPAVVVSRLEAMIFRARIKADRISQLCDDIKTNYGGIRIAIRQPEKMRKGMHPKLRHTYTRYDVPRLREHELRDLIDAVEHLQRMAALPLSDPAFDP